MRILGLAVVFVLGVGTGLGAGLGVGREAGLEAGPERPAACPKDSHIVMDAGTFSSQAGVTFRLRRFVATLVPLDTVRPGCLEKMTVMTRGEIFVDNASLTQVFDSKLAGSSSKIRDFTVENGLGKVKLSGKITKVIPLDFSIEGAVTTDGTNLLLDATKIKADGIPIKLLLEAVGQHLSSVLKLQGVKGVSVVGNTLVFAPEEIAHLKGHLQSVESTAAGLVLRYGPRAGRGKTVAAIR